MRHYRFLTFYYSCVYALVVLNSQGYIYSRYSLKWNDYMSYDGIDDHAFKNFSQMTVSQLIADARIPNTLKQQVILRLQKVGIRVGLIKLSDFERRDEDDHRRYKEKQEDMLRRWLEAMKFSDLSSKVKRMIETEKRAVDKEIDAINNTINKLGRIKECGSDSSSNTTKIKTLKRKRESLKNVKVKLKGFEKARVRAKDVKNIQAVAIQTEETVDESQIQRHDAEIIRRNHTSGYEERDFNLKDRGNKKPLTEGQKERLQVIRDTITETGKAPPNPNKHANSNTQKNDAENEPKQTHDVSS